MAALHCLIEILALDPVSDERVPVRVASAQLRSITGLGSRRWTPALSKAPTLSWQGFEGDFSSAASPGGASFEIALSALVAEPQLANAHRFYWQGAQVVIYLGFAGDAWPWRTGFVGQVSQAANDKGSLKITAAVNAAGFEIDVLTATYAGTGGVEGGADIKGQAKPLVIGRPSNVEPVLINAVDNVYQVSGYGAIEAVDFLYERGSDFGAAAANYANYATLVAATLAPGKWATCLAEGLIRLGAPAYGVITADVKGHIVGSTSPRLTGAVISALADLAGVDAGLIESESLDALDGAVPYPISLYLTAQEKFASLAQQLALPCNAQAGVSLTGKFFVARVDIERQESLTLHAQGKRMPQVTDAAERAVSAPYWQVTMGANRVWRVHSPDEIASGGYVWRGTYSATETYRKDDLVFAADGRAFVYINATPGPNHTPPVAPATSNTYWSIFGSATAGAPSGTTVGGLPADTVAGTINTDGTISTGNVVTDSVVDGSITTRGYAFTAGSVALSSGAYTWYDLQTVTVTVSAEGEPVHLLCELRWVITDNCRVKERLTRNGTVVTDSTTDDYGVNTSDNPRGGFNFVDDPGPGTYTYVYQAAANDAANASAKNRLLQVNGPKR